MAVLPPDWVGYGYGTAPTVTQDTSRTTGVELNKLSGNVKLVSAANSATAATFTVTNNKVHADDVVVACQKSGTDPLSIDITNVADGSFKVTFAAISGTTTEQPVINFMVFKNNVP